MKRGGEYWRAGESEEETGFLGVAVEAETFLVDMGVGVGAEVGVEPRREAFLAFMRRQSSSSSP